MSRKKSQPRRHVVDGETFEITTGPANQLHFTWISGPNHDYGFTSSRSDGHRHDEAEMDASIRAFLAQVDPETGYIE